MYGESASLLGEGGTGGRDTLTVFPEPGERNCGLDLNMEQLLVSAVTPAGRDAGSLGPTGAPPPQGPEDQLEPPPQGQSPVLCRE